MPRPVGSLRRVGNTPAGIHPRRGKGASRERAQRDHHRLRAGGLHRGRLCRPRPAEPAAVRGVRDRWRRPDEHHRGRELPRLHRRHHGPGPDGADARAGRAVRRRDRHRRHHQRRPRRRRQDRGRRRGHHAHRSHGHPRDGLGLPRARPAQREAAVRPRRLVVRHLRRLLLPRPGHRRRRRWRLRARGGHVPHPVRPDRSRWSIVATRCAPARSCRSAPSPTTRSSSPGTALSRTSSATPRSAGWSSPTPQTGEARELPVTGLFVAIGHDPRSELFRDQVDLDRRGLRPGRGPHHAPTSCRASSPAATSSTTPTGRPSRRPASGCAAALDAERFLAASE